MRHILLNYAFLLFWSIFWEIHSNFLFRHKSDSLRNKHWNTQKVCFSYHVWKGQILRKSRICLNLCFWLKYKKGINIYKNYVFHLKVSQILLNYASLLFWSIFGEIYWELYFLDIKVNISETRTEIVRKFVFLTIF